MKENGFKLTKERSRRYLTQTITDADYADNIALLANAHTQAETHLHSLERAAAGIGLHVNAHKTEYMCFNERGNISTLNGSSLKLVDLPQKQCLINRDKHQHVTSKDMDSYRYVSGIRKSDLTDEMKGRCFQAAVVSIWMHYLDSN